MKKIFIRQCVINYVSISRDKRLSESIAESTVEEVVQEGVNTTVCTTHPLCNWYNDGKQLPL